MSRSGPRAGFSRFLSMRWLFASFGGLVLASSLGWALLQPIASSGWPASAFVRGLGFGPGASGRAGISGSAPAAGQGPALSRQADLREPAFQDNFYGVKILGKRCWIVGYYGTILHSADRGATWELQPSGTTEALYRVVFTSPERGWAAGAFGTLLFTENGGKTWQKGESGTGEHLLGLHFADERRGWAAGARGTVIHTADGGASWSDQSIGEDVVLNAVFFVTPERGWMAGEFGTIYATTDGGRRWRKQKSPIEVDFASGESRNLFFLLFPDARTGWAFGLDGVILRSRDGSPWQVAHPNGASATVTRHHLFAAASLDGRIWAVGERGTVVAADAETGRWERTSLGAAPLSLNGIDFAPDGFGLVVGNRGLIYRTLDGGRSWERLAIHPAAPGKGFSRGS
jgi:photosystem II stability/assembly factor-like uncharacterized protein